MIAKGHDFPRVTLVGVISADVGLGLADFRAARADVSAADAGGRPRRPRRAPGEAIVQTLYPEHYSIQLACRQDYPAFFERELAYRRGHALSADGGAGQRASCAAARSTRRCRRATEIVRRLEPAAAAAALHSPRSRAGAARAAARRAPRAVLPEGHAPRRHAQRAARRSLAAMPEVRRRVTVDVDPLSVL